MTGWTKYISILQDRQLVHYFSMLGIFPVASASLASAVEGKWKCQQQVFVL
jgi:hypothetical protein